MYKAVYIDDIMIEHMSKTTLATDFKFDTRLCMRNAERAHK